MSNSRDKLASSLNGTFSQTIDSSLGLNELFPETLGPPHFPTASRGRDTIGHDADWDGDGDVGDRFDHPGSEFDDAE